MEMQSQESSTLFKIPIELRLPIYALVARNTVKDILARHHDRKAGLLQQPEHHPLSFLRTCKRLHNEARDVAHREFFTCIEIPGEPYHFRSSYEQNVDQTQKLLGYLQLSLIFPSPSCSALRNCLSSLRRVTFVAHNTLRTEDTRPNFKSIVLRNATLFCTLRLTHITIVFPAEESDVPARADQMALTRTVLAMISLISTLERLDICTSLRSLVRRFTPERRYYPFGFEILFSLLKRRYDSHFDMRDLIETMRVLEQKWDEGRLVVGVTGSWVRDVLSQMGVREPTASADSNLAGGVSDAPLERVVEVHFMNPKERERFLN